MTRNLRAHNEPLDETPVARNNPPNLNGNTPDNTRTANGSSGNTTPTARYRLIDCMTPRSRTAWYKIQHAAKQHVQ